MRLRLRLRLWTNQKEAYSYQLLSGWLRDANANVDAIANHSILISVDQLNRMKTTE